VDIGQMDSRMGKGKDDNTGKDREERRSVNGNA
jgi:hypothetical protein